MLFEKNQPKSVSECMKNFVNSEIYNADDLIDKKIVSNGLRSFFKNYEKIDAMSPPSTLTTPAKRKR